MREHYRYECEDEKSKPRLPYRETFEKAMRGDVKALYTVFTDTNYHSGDNESWVGTAWPLVHVVGDKRFATFLETLDVKKQREIFNTIFYSGSYYPRALSNGYFVSKFPRVAAIYDESAAATISLGVERNSLPSPIVKRFILLLFVLLLLYVGSYTWFRWMHIERRDRDGLEYVVFPQSDALYYFYRPLSTLTPIERHPLLYRSAPVIRH